LRMAPAANSFRPIPTRRGSAPSSSSNPEPGASGA
jgi:hypothetical protein